MGTTTLERAHEAARAGMEKALGKRFMEQLEGAVKRGAALLDKEQPGWARRIVMRELDLSNPDACVLGQLYDAGNDFLNPYMQGLTELFDKSDAHMKRMAVRCGFNTPERIGYAGFEYLDQLWLAEIRARRKTTKPKSAATKKRA